MGAYYYVTSPKLTAKARVRLADGTETILPVALYRYAYKPYGGVWRDSTDAAMNNRMHFKSGAAACEGAYARSAQAVPEFGMSFDREAMALYPLTGKPGECQNQTFRTKGLPGGLDDYEFANYEGTPVILEYLELPKGLKIMTPGEVI